jgi:hypothetical protein
MTVGDDDDLFARDDGSDPLDDPVQESTGYKPDRSDEPYVRCTLAWLKRVLPLVNSPEQVAVAMWLQRRRAVCRQEWFSVPSSALQLELGLSKSTKYRTLIHLERGKVIALARLGQQALLIKLL